MTIKTALYDSFHDLMIDARANVEARQAAGYGWPDCDAGNDAPTPCDEIIRQSVRGIQSLTDAAMRTFDDVDSLPIAPRWRARIVPGMAGRPDIPAMLAGSPAWARRVIRERAHVAPLTVVANIGAVHFSTSEQRAKRGAVIAAACRIIAASRPVNLYFVGITHDKNDTRRAMIAVRVDTTPIEIAHAAWLAGSHAAYREVILPHMMAMQGQRMASSRATCYGLSRDTAAAMVREHIAHDAVYIDRMTNDGTSITCQILADPKAWLASFVAANQ